MATGADQVAGVSFIGAGHSSSQIRRDLFGGDEAVCRHRAVIRNLGLGRGWVGKHFPVRQRSYGESRIGLKAGLLKHGMNPTGVRYFELGAHTGFTVG